MTAAVLSSCSGGAEEDEPAQVDLRSVESLKGDFTKGRIVARVRMANLDDDRSRVVLQYDWTARAVDVVLQATHRDGELVAKGYWIDQNLETAGRIKPGKLDVDWDTASRTVTFTLRQKIKGLVARLSAYGTTGRAESSDQVPDYAITTQIHRR